MPRRFPCPRCGRDVVTFLLPGEEAKCRACDASTPVPDVPVGPGPAEFRPRPPPSISAPEARSRRPISGPFRWSAILGAGLGAALLVFVLGILIGVVHPCPRVSGATARLWVAAFLLLPTSAAIVVAWRTVPPPAERTAADEGDAPR